MSDLEQRVLSQYRGFLDTWFSRGEASRSELMRFFGRPFHGLGTARHEVFGTKDALIAQFDKEFEQLPEGGAVSVKWAKAYPFSEDVYGVISEIAIRAAYGKRVMTIDPIRITSAWKFDGAEFRMVQWHASLPDASLEEEVFPGSREPRRYEEITVALSDFVGFSGSVFTVPPKRLVGELNEIFSTFDDIAKEHGVDKIKTIGDAYMSACGFAEDADDHAVRMIGALRAMFAFLERRNAQSALKWEMRAGVHSGPAVGGIIGKEKLTFDLWGDTVNLASRMESACEPGRINVSAYTYDLIKGRYPCTYRGRIETKDRGKMDMYFVD
jgi:class 3 adenylate cyclase